jgi:hypothetical protein
VYESDLVNVDKKRILENFVENDDALGQLLDFISNQYIQNGNKNNVSMSIIDGIGNKIAPPKTEGVTKINTRSTNYPGVFGRPTRIPSDVQNIPNNQNETDA